MRRINDGYRSATADSGSGRHRWTFDQAAAGQRSITRVSLLGVKIACAASSFIRVP